METVAAVGSNWSRPAALESTEPALTRGPSLSILSPGSLDSLAAALSASLSDESAHRRTSTLESISEDVPTTSSPVNRVCRWPQNFADLTHLHTVKLHKDAVTAVCLDETGSSFYSSGMDGTIKLYSIRDNGKRHRRSFAVGDLALSSCLILAAERTVVTGSWDNSVYIFALDYGRVVDVFHAHDDAVSCLAISALLSPTDYTLFTGSWDSTVKMWAVTPSGISKQPLAQLYEHDTEVTCLAVDPDGTLLASAAQDGRICVWDSRNRSHSASKFGSHTDSITSLSWSADGRYLYASCLDGSVSAFLRDGTSVSSIASPSGVGFSAMATDGALMWTGDEEGSLCLWDVMAGRVVSSWKPHASSCSITSIAVCPQQSVVVTGGQDGTIASFGLSL
eukprot:GILK01008597.1.p1 GENE.GILK01008597.1~~GILK01008597.1.p1  ORF type:complete len:426 (+),score=94.63 GILK01008597.1:100-1278(+)